MNGNIRQAEFSIFSLDGRNCSATFDGMEDELRNNMLRLAQAFQMVEPISSRALGKEVLNDNTFFLRMGNGRTSR